MSVHSINNLSPPISNTTHFKINLLILENSTVSRVTYISDRIDTIDCPDDEHFVARNMQRIGINKYKKKNCALKLVIYKECNKMTANKIKQEIKCWKKNFTCFWSELIFTFLYPISSIQNAKVKFVSFIHIISINSFFVQPHKQKVTALSLPTQTALFW